jgi:Phage integrase family
MTQLVYNWGYFRRATTEGCSSPTPRPRVAPSRTRKSGTRYLELYIAHSKTDQAGHGKHVVITEIPETNPLAPLCAVRAVTAWLDAAQIGAEVDSALFRSFPGGKAMSARGIGAGDVATIVKRLCGQSGLVDAASYAAHSLRRGFAASADTLGIPRSVAMEQGGWRDPATYDRYARSGAVRFNATSMLWEAVAKNVDDTERLGR